ncbi:hypothetical protein RFI_04781, partial [Reticulomyxa filosa]
KILNIFEMEMDYLSQIAWEGLKCGQAIISCEIQQRILHMIKVYFNRNFRCCYPMLQKYFKKHAKICAELLCKISVELNEQQLNDIIDELQFLIIVYIRLQRFHYNWTMHFNISFIDVLHTFLFDKLIDQNGVIKIIDEERKQLKDMLIKNNLFGNTLHVSNATTQIHNNLIQSIKEIDQKCVQFYFDTRVFDCQLIPSLFLFFDEKEIYFCYL